MLLEVISKRIIKNGKGHCESIPPQAEGEAISMSGLNCRLRLPRRPDGIGAPRNDRLFLSDLVIASLDK
jgi:hypothetical protein